MKVTIEFDEDEQIEAMTALKAEDYKSVIWDLDQYLRNKIKHSDEPVGQLRDARDKLHELLNDFKIILE